MLRHNVPSLRELQRQFADAIVAGDPEQAAASVIDDAPGAAARLAIYANHFRVTLIDALAAAFPVVRELVGEPFFRAAARRHIRETPPAEPCLFAYGDGFPAFLARLPEAAGLAYLGGVARLEWAIHHAWHAADAPAIEPAAAARLLTAEDAADVQVRLHPSCRLVASRYPADRIWQVHQQPCGDRPPVSLPVALDAGGCRVLVHRRDDEVGWIALADADRAFLAAILRDASLGHAVAAGIASDPGFDPGPLLAALSEGGLVTAINPRPRIEPAGGSLWP